MSNLADPATARLFGLPRTALIGVAPDSMITFTAHTESLFGYCNEELLGRPVETILGQSTSIFTGDAGARGLGSAFEWRCRRKDGEEFLAELSVSTVHTRSGPRKWVAVCEALEWRRATVTHELLASVADSSRDAIIGATLDGEVTYWNAAAERLYGYTAAEMVGSSLQKLHVGQRAEMRTLMRQIRRGGTVRFDDVPRVRKDGTTARVSVNLTPICDSRENVVGVASITRDTKGDERAQARFHALLEAATVAIIGVDRHGVIVMNNAESERLFGYAVGELVGQPVEVLVPQAHQDVHANLRRGYLAAPRTRRMGEGLSLAGRRKNGTEFPVDVALSTIDIDDGTLVAAAIRDLSQQVQREQLEQQLQHTRRLESLGQLAGGIAHDFNNLMAIIGSYAAFARQDAEITMTSDPHQAYTAIVEDIGNIEKAVGRASALTRQLLAFGRREVVRPRSLDVNGVIRDSVTLLERTLGEHITIITRLADDLASVMADPGQLEQIIVNAAVNARDAMPTGGTLSIDTGNIVVDDGHGLRRNVAPGRYVRLRFADSGVGMPKEVAARAFEPFYTTKAPGEGTGLGLSTIYGITASHGGHAAISSEPGIGTTLSILLPAESTTSAADAAHTTVVTGADDRAAPRTILLVDDEEDLRRVIERMLTRRGHRVLTAPTGAAALAVADNYGGTIDLVITDVVMPEMLGTALADAIAERRPEARVLLMSGYAQPSLLAHGTLRPDLPLLEKPFTEADLHAAITNAFQEAYNRPR